MSDIVNEATLYALIDGEYQELGTVTDIQQESPPQEPINLTPKRYNFSLIGQISRRELMRLWGYAKYWHRRN